MTETRSYSRVAFVATRAGDVLTVFVASIVALVTRVLVAALSLLPVVRTLRVVSVSSTDVVPTT